MNAPTILHPAEAIARLYGWSTSTLAAKSGLGRETLRRRFQGVYPMTWPETLALAHALGVDPQVLTEMTDEEAVRHVLDSHTKWQEKRCFLPSPNRSAA